MAAFASAITETVAGGYGSKALVYGTYASSSGATGGDISTGLETVLSFQLQPHGTSVGASYPVVNETFPLFQSAVTIVTIADEVGTWTAIGY